MTGSILTTVGLSKLLSSTPQDQLNITEIAVGDGNGTFPTLSPSMTSLVNEVWRGNTSSPIRDTNDPSILIFEGKILVDEGGFTIREVGIFDDVGDMIAIGHTNLIEKPNNTTEQGMLVVVRMSIKLDNASDVDLIYQESGYIDHQGTTNRDSANAHPASAIQSSYNKSVEQHLSELSSGVNTSLATKFKPNGQKSGFFEFGDSHGSYPNINSGLWTTGIDPYELNVNLNKASKFFAVGNEFKLSHMGYNAVRCKLKTPPAPDGLDKLDNTGRFASLAAAITAGGTDLSASHINVKYFTYLRTPRNRTDDHNVTSSGYMFPIANKQFYGASINGVNTDGSQPNPAWPDGLYSSDSGITGNTVSLTELMNNPALMTDPYQHLYVDENGNIRQLTYEYRVERTALNFGDNPSTYDVCIGLGCNYDAETGEFYRTEDGIEYIITPIVLEQALNQGAYHPEFNELGTTEFVSETYSSTPKWYESNSKKPLTIADCFTVWNGISGGGGSGFSVPSINGFISSGVSGRYDGKYHDAIYADLIHDIRVNANVVDNDRLNIAKRDALIAATFRGCQMMPMTKFIPETVTVSGAAIYEAPNSGGTLKVAISASDLPQGQNNSVLSGLNSIYWLLAGDNGNTMRIRRVHNWEHDFVYWPYNTNHIYLYGSGDVAAEFNAKFPAGTKLWIGAQYNSDVMQTHKTKVQDIAGHPVNISSIYQNGIFAQWIPDVSTNAKKLTRKVAQSVANVSVVSTNNTGATWTSSITALDYVTNVANVFDTTETGVVALINYDAYCNLANRAAVAVPVSDWSDAYMSNNHVVVFGNVVAQSTIDYVCENNTSVAFVNLTKNPAVLIDTVQSYAAEHITSSLPSAEDGFKFISSVVEINNTKYLQIIAKQIIYDAIDGYGDNNKFEPTNYSVLAQDENGNYAVRGTWLTPLNYHADGGI